MERELSRISCSARWPQVGEVAHENTACDVECFGKALPEGWRENSERFLARKKL